MVAATISRSQVFKAAWAETKAYFARCEIRGIAPAETMRQKLAYELRQAWAAAKMTAYQARLAVASSAEKARAAIDALHNKTRWTQADHQRHDRLCHAANS